MQFKNLIAAAALAAGASAQTMNLTAALASQPSLSVLTGLLGTQPALVGTLAGASNITILAPSNAALGAFLNTTAGMAAGSMPDAVTALLTYHVLSGLYPASAFTAAPQFFPTLLTNATYANVTGGQRVEGMLNGTGVVITSGLLATSNVVTANVMFTGGVIHIIDKVLTVPVADSATAVAANLTSLAGALTTAGLVSTVDGLKDVTIFAPTNAAFAALGPAAANLTKAQLTSILTYHVVAGTVGYSSILTNTTLKTVNGASVNITVTSAGVMVNNAKVVVANVLTANGVVHVIDSVLMPPASNSTSGSGTASSSGSMASATSMSSAAGAGYARAMPTGVMGMGALLGGAMMVAAGL